MPPRGRTPRGWWPLDEAFAGFDPKSRAAYLWDGEEAMDITGETLGGAAAARQEELVMPAPDGAAGTTEPGDTGAS